MPKISIVMLLLELNTQIGFINLDNINPLVNANITLPFYNGENINILQTLLLVSSLLSLILGTVVGLAQTKIKRLLAYSTISHVGFILLSLAIATEQSIEALLFYIVQYSITNLNTFLIIIALSYVIYNSINNKSLNNKDINYISQLKGLMFSNPILSLSLCICLFSMAGIPPLIGFFSKLFVLYSAIQSGYFFMAFVAILVSIISASYYLKIVRVLNTANSDEDTVNEVNNDLLLETDKTQNNNNTSILLSNYHSFIISSLTLFLLFFVVNPSLILSSMRILSISIFYC
jgi:NADH-ubiquinone oxidoreductase chain 2